MGLSVGFGGEGGFRSDKYRTNLIRRSSALPS